MIEGVRVDIAYFPHKRIQLVVQYDKIRLYGGEDLMAMKVNAILRRGKKRIFGTFASYWSITPYSK
jgi:hypothetical protein